MTCSEFMKVLKVITVSTLGAREWVNLVNEKLTTFPVTGNAKELRLIKNKIKI